MNRTKYRYASFAEKHLDIQNVTGSEAMVRCPAHDDGKASCQFNLETGLWVCFAGSCNAKGNIKSMARELGLEGFKEPQPGLDQLFDVLKELRVPTKRDGKPPVKPESMLSRYDFPTDYWTGRGFSPKTVRLFNLGIDIMDDAVTIPIRDEDFQLLGVIRRYLDEDVDLRYKYPKGFKRSLNLFGSWLMEGTDTSSVVLVEGAVDAMKCWQAGVPAVALYGSSISPTQVRLLRRLGVTDVTLFFDNDKAGRKAVECCLGKKTHRRAGKEVTDYDSRTDLRRWFIVREAIYTKEMRRKRLNDPGACPSKVIRQVVQSSKMLNLAA